MPVVIIHFRGKRTREELRALAKNVTNAVVESFGGDPEGVHIHMVEKEPDHIATGGVLLSDKQ